MPDSSYPVVDIDRQAVRTEISQVYSRVASDPDGDFHFHRGPAYAVHFLGYDPSELAALPAECTASFAGIANPHAIAPILPDETVLDIGCGAGMDLLLAARKVGPKGRTIGIDMTEAMRDRALASAAAAGLANIEVHHADATALPLPDAGIDVVISNGVLNLVPEKDRAFAEIWRVLRPGGRLQLGDIVLDAPLSKEARGDVGLWTDWIAGALPEAELVPLLQKLGFEDVRIMAHFDCFRGTQKEDTATKYGVRGANVFARKPKRAQLTTAK